MPAELIVAPEATGDLDEAYGWYEAQRRGLGEEFLRCVDARVQSILRSPESCPVLRASYRRGLVRRFPYAVAYEYVDGTVTVYGVFHSASDPSKWRHRLP